jgi:hypothetical protein
MRSSESSDWIRLTADQRERLKHITNPKQRERLLQAIAGGEEIPDYAWEPVSEELMDTAFDGLRFWIARLQALADERGVPYEEVLDSLTPEELEELMKRWFGD